MSSPGRPHKAQVEGNVHGLLVSLARRGCGLLRQGQVKGFGFRIVMCRDLHMRRSRLFVPAEKLREIAPRGVGHAGTKSSTVAASPSWRSK